MNHLLKFPSGNVPTLVTVIFSVLVIAYSARADEYAERIITQSRAFDLLVASDGRLYYIDHFGGELGTLDVGTGEKTPLVTGLRAPYHMAEFQHRLYFTEFGTTAAQYRDGAVSVFDPDSSTHTRLREGLHAAASIEADSAGNLYVLEVPGTSTSFGGINRLLKFPGAGGEYDVLIDHMSVVNPLSLLLDEQNDQLYIGDGGVYSPSDLGSLIAYSLVNRTSETIMTNLPTVWDLEFDARGNILVAGFGDDYGSLRTVSYIPPTLDQINPLRTGLYAWTVASDGAGSIYFATGRLEESIRLLSVPVPEPTAGLLLVFGCAALRMMGRVFPHRRSRVLITLHRRRSFQRLLTLEIPPPTLLGRTVMKTPTHLDRFADRFAVAVVLSLTAVLPPAIVGADTLRTVALTGQQAPGTDSGVTFDTFGAYFSGPPSTPVFRGPALNDAGEVAFRANLAGSGVHSMNDQGVWSEGSGSLSLVARTGSPAPGGGDFGRFPEAELFSPMLNDAGQTAFYGAVTNGDVGIWSESFGSLGLVARDGSPAPGTPSGVSFWFPGLVPDFKINFAVPPWLNNAGQTAFTAALQGAGVNSSNNSGAWLGSSGSVSLVLRAGMQAADTPNGVRYDLAQLPIALNDAGQSAFYSFLDGTGVDETNWAGIWSGASGGSVLAARMGDPAPGTPSGVSFGTLFGPLGFNNSGQIAIQSTLVGSGVNNTNDEGLWLGSAGSLALVARRGSQAVGTPGGVNYGTFRSWIVLNDADQIAFLAGLEGAGVDESNNEGLWLGEMDDLTLVARRGDEAPGAPNGVNFSDLQHPALNSAGQVAFRGDLTGSSANSGNDKGIWATDPFGVLQLIARSGDQLEVAPGDFRTLSDINFSTASGNGDGRVSGFNNLGQLAFWASFTDGSQGVFVSNAVAHVPGDFNNDGTVDAADYVVWRKSLGTIYTDNDYAVWRSHFGASLGPGSGAVLPSAASLSAAVPEPTALALAAFALVLLVVRRK